MQIICEGFSYDLQIELSYFKQFQIRSRGILSHDKKDRLNDFLLKTDYHIRGSFRSFDDRIRINAQLIESKTNRLVWGDRIEGSRESLFMIQENLIQKLVASLQQQLDTDLLREVRRAPSGDFKAYEYWLYGLIELKKGSPEKDLEARKYFEKALESNPNYSLACSGMSLTYFNEWSCQVWEKWEISQKGARSWAEKALHLDDQNYIANLILGKILLFEGSHQEAEVYLRKALMLNPNDCFNLIQVSSSFVYLGHLDEAWKLYQQALEIDSLNEDYYHPVGALILFEQGFFKKCLKVGTAYARKGWVDFPAVLAASHFHLGDYEKAAHYWKMYVNAFREKISRHPSEGEPYALQWIIEINPYSYNSNFEPYWEWLKSNSSEEMGFREIQPSQKPAAENSFTCDGKICTLTYQGETVHLPYSKGLGDIARLVRDPGRSFHCNELMGGGISESGVEIMDERARKEYQERLLELQHEIQIAGEQSNSQLLANLHTEYDQLLDHLEASLNVRGQIRKRSASSDKARSAVTQRIKGALEKLKGDHPALYHHLSRTIHTGTNCIYQPDQPITWIVSDQSG